MLSLREVTRSLGGTPALRGVSLEVGRGERLALLGPSGAGKTTLFRVLNLTLRPDGGAYAIGGEDAAGMNPARRREVRATIATIHQQHDIVPRLSVLGNVLAGRLGQWTALRSLRARVWPRADDTAEAAEVLRRVGILDLIHRRSDRLSGGQQQRVAIARALFQGAQLILADEPVASVDPGLSEGIVALLAEASEHDGRTVVVNLHQPDLARRFFPRIVAMSAGRIAFDVPAADVGDDRLRGLFGAGGTPVASPPAPQSFHAPEHATPVPVACAPVRPKEPPRRP
ncbi:MAG: Phosphate-import ATP-binding protein PhnC [Planctomycetes bacterium]|nr:Phosphate-import ATP-binding protein PhnC [Planctomycetota bacterium]